MKRMSTKTHGIIDYITSGLLVALPRALGFSDRASILLEGSGAMAARATIAGVGAFEIAAALLTEPHAVADDRGDREQTERMAQSGAAPAPAEAASTA
jgi:hypothetical protein